MTCRGGWPEAVDLSPLDAQAIVREYLSAICYESAPDQGLDPFVAERIIASLARNLGQAATYGTIREDALGSTGDDLADRQIGEYLSFFNRIYLVSEVPGWEPPSRSKKRLQVKPKRYFGRPFARRRSARHVAGCPARGLADVWTGFREPMSSRPRCIYPCA